MAVPTSVPCCWRLLRLGDARLECRRHLQVEHAEHAEGEHHEQPRKQHDDPRLLEERLRLLPGKRERGTCDRVGDRHAEHVGERQREGATARDRAVTAGAHDDAREDRDHRQHAGREREPEPGDEEPEDDGWQAAVADHVGEARPASIASDPCQRHPGRAVQATPRAPRVATCTVLWVGG